MCKFGRKFTSALLALALFVSLLPIGAAPAQALTVTLEGKGTAEDPYLIKDEDDLAQFARIVSGEYGFYDQNPYACAKLTANIDSVTLLEVPIGTDGAPGLPAKTFYGTFDGDGHTINNINIVDKEKTTPPGVDPGPNDYRSSPDVGLFARLGSGGTVKNLKVTGSVSGGERGVNVGGIVGANNRGTVTNCTFSGSVNGGSATNVGGIVGQNGIGGSVTDCTFSSGSLSGSGNVGGVVGQNNSSVTNCSNNVGFGISGSGNFGGVVGNNSGSVTDCSNSGGFSVPMTNPPSSASGNLGGVVGQNSGADARITSCYNIGDLCNDFPSGSFDGNLGGVVGNNSDNSSVTNCYNSEKFGSFINSTVGGVIGSNTDTSNVTNCYFLQQDNVPAQGIGSGETTGATPVDDLTKQEQFSDWDFANTWRISQSLGFPVLQENAQDGLPPGLGTEASPYRISTADELKSFRDIVNDVDGNADGNPAAHAELMNDIDLSSICNETNPWEPIGNGGGTSGGNTFEGYFDGQGHSVKNLVVGL